MPKRVVLISFLLCVLVACRQQHTLFEKLPESETGINFTNTITEDQAQNVFTYQYYYNGNGVAIGDINNDGLADVFFTGNKTPSKLYLNKGGFRFEDITATAGVAGKDAWRTGANMVDINGDGLLDIYVCYSGFGSDTDRANQLFINQGTGKNGVPSFSEQAAAYGIDAPGTYTSQAAFFDFDQDGDLDMFLLNHAAEFYSPFFNTTHLRNLRHPKYGNRLYRNDAGKFSDISASAGIYGSGLNFGLGIAISDINNDGLSDILVSNDFHEQDFCYLNKGDGTFKEIAQQAFPHMSRNTMGLDIADYNNDLLPDVVTMDMLPETNYRQKILQGPDEYDKYTLMVDSGYGHQNNRNVLQLNRGSDANGMPVFSEIGQLAGVSNTDWSWAALFADLDNDGWKDLFITNGYLRESTNLDFMKYQVAEAYQQAVTKGLDVSTRESYERNMPLYDLVQKMPSTKISNYAFRNSGDLRFTDESKAWGLDEPGVSNGAAYADLDNDGDLDLIVCNNNDPAWVYRNNTDRQKENNFIRIKLTGSKGNTFGLGAKVVVTTVSGSQLQEQYPVRGYQSSVDYVLNFGLGKEKEVKEVKVLWPRGGVSVLRNPAINKAHLIKEQQRSESQTPEKATPAFFTDVTPTSGLRFRHQENEFVDFKREYLIPYQLSRQGARMSKGDVNGDGLEDVYIGGAAEQSGALFLQTADGRFVKGSEKPWQSDAIYEDVGSLFLDADRDGDLDLYVVSGGSEWSGAVPGLQDRLYENDGKGNFRRQPLALPREAFSGSCVTAADFDKDGDLDLFVGARSIPGRYPFSEGNMILRNDGGAQGLKFTDVTDGLAGVHFTNTGMVTDATWSDIDKDGWMDLIVVGDWMPVKIYRNEQGKKLSDITAKWGLEKTGGWWCKILPADVDKDGDVDFIVGNAGTNSQFRANEQEPLITYAGPFAPDGSIVPLMTYYVQHASYPFNSRDEVVEKMPALNKRFLRYADFANATINDILSPEQLAAAAKLYIYNTQSSLLINEGSRFSLKPLPLEAQFSMANGILYKDFTGDGKEDILLTGNFYPFRVQQGRSDASIGSLLMGNGKGSFTPVAASKSGLLVKGDVRDMLELNGGKKTWIVVSKNNDSVQVLSRN
ncbi:Repeat domain-containing protein [Cnuella takakiae]|uniref:Repeat domain-containing protein n=1 Tax=Cnuella takakiae TaxID=1302690 RepID=A0A1M4X142_9BACT|nr:VCBS repeat-containing protein [Cnuella takakiae]OLY91565.1 hypothetical protein BUE76_06345 [Cnuella takakiae]SHE87170.1 Repeat domain-containing protein [Cnuella takakiae]